MEGRMFSSNSLPPHCTCSCCSEVREQRDEHPPVQCSRTPLLAAQLHGRLHLVTAFCRRERYQLLLELVFKIIYQVLFSAGSVSDVLCS